MPNIWDMYEAQRKSGDPEVLKALTPAVEKVGSRFSSGDMKTVQECHDKIAAMCGKAHCSGNDRPGGTPNTDPVPGMLGDAGKAGARHSMADMMQLKAIHDACTALGCKCQVLAIFLCLIASSAMAADVVVANPGLTLNLTAVVNTVIGIVLTAVLSIIGTWINERMKDKQAAAVLNEAVKNSVGAIQQAAQGAIVALNPQVPIPGVVAQLQPGVQYVLDHAGGEAERFGITPESIASKVSAQIGLTAIAHNLAVTASPAPEAPAPLAPV